MDKMELCNCNQCRKFEFTNEDGKKTQGVLVSWRTRNRHWAKSCQSEAFLSEIISKAKISEPHNSNNDHSQETQKVDYCTEKTFMELIYLMLCFIAWLYVVGGLSREKCEVGREYLMSLIHLLRQINNGNMIWKQIPKDVQTVVKKLDLTPELNHYICCPKCFSTYDIETAPHDCKYKDFKTSLPCGASLFHPCHFTRHLRHIGKISTHYSRSQQQLRNRKPFSLYVTQDFSNWLRWFIPQSEELIENWKKSVLTPNDAAIYDYQQSPAWEALYPKHQKSNNSTTLELAFSLFTDWFNPISNKAAGKQVSLGVLAQNCLNLPPNS
ncbi:hypothetical protein O181_085830 [Austropuccinia psidii MF-1]|uniref:Uncharacterized protein n=1 Tax=Austropuccinia psidii MF-1 TaxID=1389203 RepID=A0A9Q3IN25_9BASI|nr:hypothetical protein [Austropuccinia psidii MF-1]